MKNNIDALQDAIFLARQATGEIISLNAAMSDIADTNYRSLLVAKIIHQRRYIDKLVDALDHAARLADPKALADD